MTLALYLSTLFRRPTVVAPPTDVPSVLPGERTAYAPTEVRYLHPRDGGNLTWPAKYASARKDYVLDWKTRLALFDDRVISCTATADNGVTVVPASIMADDTRQLVWLQGGQPGVCRVTLRVVTANERTDVLQVRIVILPDAP